MNESFYDKIELTEQEIKEAIHEGKKRKYYKLKNASYWLEQQERSNKKVSHKKPTCQS